ncbi:MAG TPA: histidine kinase [Chitinophagaceae bacterium]
MTLYPLVFSNNPRYRVTRHVMFWLLWILYFTAESTISRSQKYDLGLSFFSSLVEVTITTPFDIAFCYGIIYFLLPRFLFRGQFITLAAGWVVFSLLLFFAFMLFNLTAGPVIREGWFGLQPRTSPMNWAWSFFNLFATINMEGGLAAAIKLGKMWYVKASEVELLKKEKLRIEPEMQQGKVHPAFLVNTLNKIEQLAMEKPSVIPGVIGKIKNLLLYAVYDNGASHVSLEKEMKLLEEFVEIERAGRDLVYINFKMIGDPRNKKIAPFIALPLVENSFRQLSALNVPQKFIDLNILVEQNQFNLDIAWSKPIDTSTLTNGGSALLQNIGKRLSLLYPQSHSLKILIEPERFQVKMGINLSGAIV